MKYYLGCDPGWTNLAYAWLSEDNMLSTGCIAPKKLGRGILAPTIVDDALADIDIILGPYDATTVDTREDITVVGAVMERFVYYDGVRVKSSEQILMVTGQMQMYTVSKYNVVPTLFRAFDWKTRICKHIYKRGFRNPSENLDKEFSLAAARFLFPDYEFKTDHEADAACMAYIARILDL